MPYIEKDRRTIYDRPLNEIINHFGGAVDEPGVLAYCVYRLALGWARKKNLSFGRMALVLGTLRAIEGVFVQYELLPYEGSKLINNGTLPEEATWPVYKE